MPRPTPGNVASVREILSTLPLFACLTPEEYLRLEDGCRILHFRKGDPVFGEGESVEGLLVVLSGTVKIARWDENGDEDVLHLVRSGNFLAETAVFQSEPFPFAATAVNAVHALLVRREVLIELIRCNPELALQLLAALSIRLRMFAHKLSSSRIRVGTSARLAAWLSHRRRMSGSNRVANGLSREVLAGVLGFARETLSRALNSLVENGLIELDGKEIVILKPDELERLGRR